MMLASLFFIFLSEKLANAADIANNFQDQAAEGEKLYVDLQKKSIRYGDCWKQAMADIHVGCRQLTEEVQGRLALSFANCFLTHAGINPCPCSSDVPLSSCLKNSSDRVFSTYREFFTHTQTICHYLQHRRFQEEAASAVQELTQNSQSISKKLDESSKSQSKILDLQQASVAEQKKLISHGRVLNAELQRSRESARDIYNEFKMTTSEQKLLLFEVFDRMKNLQNFVLGEFTGVYTVAYYIVAATIIYILTSVPRTAESRIWLILIITSNAILEKILTSYALDASILEVNPVTTYGLLQDRIWLCRKFACTACLTVLIVAYYRYKDYNMINNELLREIQQQNAELQNFIKGLTLHENIQNISAALKTNKHLSRYEKNINSNCKGTWPDTETESDVYLTSTPLNHLKETTKKKSAAKKKINPVKSPGNISSVSLKKESYFTELVSPNSSAVSRYNLRSSSRLNSPAPLE